MDRDPNSERKTSNVVVFMQRTREVKDEKGN